MLLLLLKNPFHCLACGQQQYLVETATEWGNAERHVVPSTVSHFQETLSPETEKKLGRMENSSNSSEDVSLK